MVATLAVYFWGILSILGFAFTILLMISVLHSCLFIFSEIIFIPRKYYFGNGRNKLDILSAEIMLLMLTEKYGLNKIKLTLIKDFDCVPLHGWWNNIKWYLLYQPNGIFYYPHRANSISGFYDYINNEILIREKYLTEATLKHEFAHALYHERYLNKTTDFPVFSHGYTFFKTLNEILPL